LAPIHDVTALVRPTSNIYRLAGISRLRIDQINSDEWANYIFVNKPEVLILADWWGVGNQDRNADQQYDNIIRMSKMANAAKKTGVQVVIGVGSQAELGPVLDVITEDLPDQPTTKYGFAKAQNRSNLCEILINSNTRFAWLRIFSTYGPLDTGAWLIPQLVDNLSCGKAMDLTRGEQEWSYLHAYDLAHAFETVIQNVEICGTVNVGNPNTILLKDAILEIAMKLDAVELLNFGAVDYRSDQVMKLKPLCEKLSKFNWAPEVSFSDGASQTISWLTRGENRPLKLKNENEIIFYFPARP
jgi:nucleoside-diphosphate-sugar epimerase